MRIEHTAVFTMPFVGQKPGDRPLFGANFANPQDDPIALKRAQARKQAYKIVGDTLCGEKKLDDELKGRAEHVKQLGEEMKAANDGIRAIDEQKEALRASYGVEKDSEEQKDLELLEKLGAYRKGDFTKKLSDEEMERVSKLGGKEMTEYQKRALALEACKAPYMTAIMEAQKGMIEENAIIRETDKERLKSSPMLEATKQADEVLAAASDEIAAMLIDEAKQHIDEVREEEQEKAEEKAEEEEKKEEQLAAAREHREELEELAGNGQASSTKPAPAEIDVLSGDAMTEKLLKMDELNNGVRQEVQDIMNQMKLVADDMKGIQVDRLL